MNGPATEAAPAKVNLHLHLTGRRPDGYHLLDSLVVFAPACSDRVTLADRRGLAIDGPFGAALAPVAGVTEGGVPDGGDNLVTRAARALAAVSGRGPDLPGLRLEKNLPIASGIGGGSADAAATLRLLARAWDLPPSRAAEVAPGLGADVPVCLAGRPARMQGIGEILLPPPRLPAFALLLVNPGVAVSTADVFRAARGQAFRPAASLPDGWSDAGSLCRDLGALTRNDLEAPARATAPVIGDVLEALARTGGCLLARMSGSGATCFGIYATLAGAEAASAELDRSWWRAASPVGQ